MAVAELYELSGVPVQEADDFTGVYFLPRLVDPGSQRSDPENDGRTYGTGEVTASTNIPVLHRQITGFGAIKQA